MSSHFRQCGGKEYEEEQHANASKCENHDRVRRLWRRTPMQVSSKRSCPQNGDKRPVNQELPNLGLRHRSKPNLSSRLSVTTGRRPRYRGQIGATSLSLLYQKVFKSDRLGPLPSRAPKRALAGDDSGAHSNSTATAVASPPPMHSAATPRLRPRFSSAASSVTMMRAPLAPMGWPRAQAPPLTLTLA